MASLASTKRFARVLAAVTMMGATIASAQSVNDKDNHGGEITVGIHNQAPWGYRNADGSVAGVGPDMIRAVLGPIGVKKINFVVVDFDALIPSLIARRIDAVASGLAITPPRCKQVIFSDPDLAIGDAILVKKGNPLNIHSFADVVKNPSIRMAGGRGSSAVEHAIAAGIPKDWILLLKDVESSVGALLAGRIDADTESASTVISTLKDPNVSSRLERAVPFTGLVQNGKQVANYAAIAFRPEDEKLRDLYNESLAKLKADGSVKKIFANYGFGDAEMVPDDVTAKKICGTSYR
ncbi:amino acid ABC transporter substrate-binding protein (PAAT family) [Paraburkholderia sp. RAU2J]|uniref:ectoine/hydroxyectoine ABC transporter substrate-binding protein EhuB n=1 Tax=Paraburkholderia sp. RAU2J TaxID=1938810 RepID=UPI000EB0C4D5|nr:ectoine/hydroxyectoine ABC transporter substrate-binding protein EhuB [Paraburkholderia sp. RAU2J]RKT10795.1 amino acid ABC transporter substrate-binding protein (PAAT family) [Paraburkholderia sp. RAU2J]